jgi:DNA-binding CsgD family transcriptional regulator
MVAFEFHRHFRRLVAPGFSVNGVALSLRQVQCLEWIAMGKTIAEVAFLLGVARSTAKRHLEIVREKLDVRTTAQAVAALATLQRTI